MAENKFFSSPSVDIIESSTKIIGDIFSEADFRIDGVVEGNITTTGTIETAGSELKITGAEPRLTFTDTDNNPDFQIWANAQKFAIYDSTNSATRLHIDSNGRVLLGTTNTTNASSNADDLVISGSGNKGITIHSTVYGNIYFSDGSGSNQYVGYCQWQSSRPMAMKGVYTSNPPAPDEEPSVFAAPEPFLTAAFNVTPPKVLM